MIPFLTYPLALAGLAAVPALAAIYIMRNRFRRRTVSSLVLWRFQVQSKAGGAKIHRLQLPWLFFLELFALVTLVAAATGPNWKMPQSARPMIVVLDDAFSLRAAQNGQTAQVRARAFLDELMRRAPPRSVRLILAGPQPRTLGNIADHWREAVASLDQWQCRAPDSDLDGAVSLAVALGRNQANILVLTDHKPPGEKIANPRLEWHAFGSPLDNVAIVNASRTPFGEQDRCLLEIANYSSSAHMAPIEVQLGTNVLQRSLLAMAPRETQRLVFNLSANTNVLRATLGDDALPDDNQIQLLPPLRQRVRVRVALTNESMASLVNRTLDATSLRAALMAEPDLVIQDHDASLSNAWVLSWPGAGATNAYTGPFIVDTAQPLAAGLSLQGVVWAAAGLTNAAGDIPVLMAGNIPLLSTRLDAAGGRHLTLNLNPELSTVQDTPDWPILFWNLLSWRIAEMPGIHESNVRLGGDVKLKTYGAPVTVVPPEGGTYTMAKTGDEVSLETPWPGLYTVMVGAVHHMVAVNTLSPAKSDLANALIGHWGQWSEESDQRLEQSSTAWLLGLLGVAALAAHLYFVATGKGAR